MTTTQLADFARLLEKVQERWPDAPGLPEGCWITGETRPCGRQATVMLCRGTFVPRGAALALCVTTAMEIGAWWTRQARKRECEVVHVWNWGWTVDVSDYDAERGSIEILSTIGTVGYTSLRDAALAMLRGIVEP